LGQLRQVHSPLDSELPNEDRPALAALPLAIDDLGNEQRRFRWDRRGFARVDLQKSSLVMFALTGQKQAYVLKND
jgi:hypothetical protein